MWEQRLAHADLIMHDDFSARIGICAVLRAMLYVSEKAAARTPNVCVSMGSL